MTPSRPAGAGVAYAAALWALIFAIFHVVWACGWYVGLDPAQARLAFRKPLFFAWDLVVAVMCAVGAVVALAPVRPWGRRLPLRLLRFAAWTGTVLLVLRAAASVIQVTYLAITRRLTAAHILTWEPWFWVGAVLFSVITWRFWRTGRQSPSWYLRNDLPSQ